MKTNIANIYKSSFDKIEVPERLEEKILRIPASGQQTSVRRQASDSLNTTKNAAAGGAGSSHEELRNTIRARRRIIIAAIAAAVAMFGAAFTYAAANGFWSRGLSEALNADTESQQMLYDQGLASVFSVEGQDMAVTNGGVTISPEMVVTDGSIAYISFKVSGYDYEIDEGEQLLFADSKDNPIISLTDISGAELNPASIDNGAFYKDAEGQYRDKDGNMEYIMRVMTASGAIPYADLELAEKLFGASVHIEFRNLATKKNNYKDSLQESETIVSVGSPGEEEIQGLIDSAYKNTVSGTWTFDITLPDREKAAALTQSYDLNTQAGDSGVVINRATLTPVSIKLEYTSERETNAAGAQNAFRLLGIRMKDGSVLKNEPADQPLILEAALENRKNELFPLGTVFNPENADALLVNIYGYDNEIVISLDGSNAEEALPQTVGNTESASAASGKSKGIEITDITGNRFVGKLMVVEDPGRIFCGTVPEFCKGAGKTVQQIIDEYEKAHASESSEKNSVLGGINGGSFAEEGADSFTALPLGMVISEGEVVYSEETDSLFHMIGFTNDNRLVLKDISADEALEEGIRDAVCTDPVTCPFLIIDGELTDEIERGFNTDVMNPRSAIGQRSDGSVLLITIDGRQAESLGATMQELAECMLENGAVTAAALTGGTSVQMYYGGKIQNSPYSPEGPRTCPTAWLIWQ